MAGTAKHEATEPWNVTPSAKHGQLRPIRVRPITLALRRHADELESLTELLRAKGLCEKVVLMDLGVHFVEGHWAH